MKTNEYLKKDGTLNASAKKNIERLRNGYPRKLSDFYASRTIKYPDVLDSELFIISNDKDVIIEAGFRTTVKSIVRINEKNQHVINFLASTTK